MNLAWPILLSEAETGSFGLNFNIFQINLINFLIVLAFLIYVGRGYLGKILGDRRTQIEEEIRTAEQAKAAAEKELAQAKQNLAQAQQEAQQILARGQENAQQIRAKILADTEREAARLQESALKDIEGERQRVINQLRAKLVADALALTEQQLPSQLTEDTQRRLLDQSINLLG
ncbi:MAG: F0F1 ATP synthase subunit B [Gloeobacterales cyanobacterium]